MPWWGWVLVAIPTAVAGVFGTCLYLVGKFIGDLIEGFARGR